MFLRKITNILNSNNADIRILTGNAILEPLEDTALLWRRMNGRNEKLEFKKAFSIEYKDFDVGIRDCTYVVHGREFTDLSCMMGTDVMKIDDEYELREYDDGRRFIFYGGAIPTFDSGDREWNSSMTMAVYYDEAGVNMIYCSFGYKIPQIKIYLGLQRACSDFKRLMEFLHCPDFGIRFDTDS